MKNFIGRLVGFGLVLVVLMVFVEGCQVFRGGVVRPEGKVALFNGDNFDGWKLFVPDKEIDVDDIWSVRNGVIRCKGVPNGYMRTKRKYADYALHVEWRWVGEATNSGVLLHSSGKDQVWPRTIEAQLKAGSAGDFVLIRHTGVTVDGKALQDVEKMYVVAAKKGQSSEKEAGEWNSYDIVCKGDTIRLSVNGVVQNEGTNATDTSGWICLQSEGSMIEFRNIYIEAVE